MAERNQNFGYGLPTNYCGTDIISNPQQLRPNTAMGGMFSPQVTSGIMEQRFTHNMITNIHTPNAVLNRLPDGRFQLVSMSPQPITPSFTQRRINPYKRIGHPNTQNVAYTSPSEIPFRRFQMGTTGKDRSTTNITTTQDQSHTKIKDVILDCKNLLECWLEQLKNNKQLDIQELTQALIDSQITTTLFLDCMQNKLKVEIVPKLITFLNIALPLVRKALITKELSLAGIRPPSQNMNGTTSTTKGEPTASGVQFQLRTPQSQFRPIACNFENKSKQHALYTDQTQMGFNVHPKVAHPIQQQQREISSVPSTTVHASTPTQLLQSSITNNDNFSVAASSNISETSKQTSKNAMSKNIPGIIPTKNVNSANETAMEEEFLLNMPRLQERIKSRLARKRFQCLDHKVAELISHAIEERLKNMLEDLADLTKKRIENTEKNLRNPRIIKVMAQMKILEEISRIRNERSKMEERKNEDPHHAELIPEEKLKEANITENEDERPSKRLRMDDHLISGTKETRKPGTIQATMKDFQNLCKGQKDLCRSKLYFLTTIPIPR